MWSRICLGGKKSAVNITADSEDTSFAGKADSYSDEVARYIDLIPIASPPVQKHIQQEPPTIDATTKPLLLHKHQDRSLGRQGPPATEGTPPPLTSLPSS